MSSLSSDAAIPCHRCGYDLRATPLDGVCPECEASVAESIRVAAIPLRPLWRDSDPRWRRRMLAGAWVMVLVPLFAAIDLYGRTTEMHVPNIFDWKGSLDLKETFAIHSYRYLAFCVGAVLFFSKERGRRRGRLDWTRRWGVLMSYVVLLLGAASDTLIVALVLIGIAALFHDLPPDHQPAATDLLREAGVFLAHYGPHYSDSAYLAASACCALVVLLACVAIYNALRCSAPRVLAILLLLPISLICLVYMVGAALWMVNIAPVHVIPEPPELFFLPYMLVPDANANRPPATRALEFVKWGTFLVVALWLSVAQARAWRRRGSWNPNG